MGPSVVGCGFRWCILHGYDRLQWHKNDLLQLCGTPASTCLHLIPPQGDFQAGNIVPFARFQELLGNFKLTTLAERSGSRGIVVKFFSRVLMIIAHATKFCAVKAFFDEILTPYWGLRGE